MSSPARYESRVPLPRSSALQGSNAWMLNSGATIAIPDALKKQCGKTVLFPTSDLSSLCVGFVCARRLLMDKTPTCGCDMFGSKEEEEKKTSLDTDGSHPKSTNDSFTEFELRLLISDCNTSNTLQG